MRTQPKILATTIAAVSLISLSGQSHAAAFQLNYQSIPSLSMANAGRATLAQDATVIFTNPAGLSLLKQQSISVNASGVFPSTEISNTSASSPTSPTIAANGTNEGDMVDNAFIPSAFWALPIPNSPVGDGLSAGVGVYGSFGFDIDYEDTFQGRLFADESKLKVITVQPTVSYRVTPEVSIGAGVTFNRADGTLTSATGAANTDRFSIKGDDTAVGYNIGVMFDATPELRLGATYRSKVDYTLKGNISASRTVAPLPAFVANGSGSLDVTTPAAVELSFSYDVVPELTVYGTYSRTMWKKLDTIQVKTDLNAAQLQQQYSAGIPALVGSVIQQQVAAQLQQIQNPTPAQIAAVTQAVTDKVTAEVAQPLGAAALIAADGFANPPAEKLGYQDTNIFALGVSHQFSPDLVLRAGVARDDSVSDVHTSVRLPTGKRHLFSIGAGYNINDNMSVDLMYAYADEKKTLVTASRPNQLPNGNAIAAPNTYNATFKNTAHLVGAQLNYTF
ncbi:MAG: OmpP1/FadL family transporter [Pseudomonadota bacterium]|nr:OmpP1/FadL family transporter [Pseudomonadota bacterium]